MIKSVAFFPLQCARNSPPVMAAILESLKKRKILTEENSWKADAAIVWSVLWHGRMQANRPLYEHYRSINKPVIVVDVGTLHRGHTWKVAINNINALGYYGHQKNLDLDRPKKLNVKLKKQKHSNGSILIAAQHRNSEQLSGINVEAWINQRINELRSVTDRPILVRPHPRSPINYSLLPKDVQIQHPVPLPNTYDSFDFDAGFHAVVNYSSGPGIQAAIAGARPIVNQASLAYPVSIEIAKVEENYTIDRSNWLIEICHTEYTVDELKQGLWLKRLEQAL